MPVDAITTEHVLAVLEPIWTTKTETADRVRARIERILASAKALGLRRGENPAAWKENLADLLPPPRRVKKAGHHKSLAWERCPGFVASVLPREGEGARADVAEAALAHVTRDKVLAAYQRGELFELRISMMAEWARFLLPHGLPTRS